MSIKVAEISPLRCKDDKHFMNNDKIWEFDFMVSL